MMGVPLEPGERVIWFKKHSYLLDKIIMITLGVFFLNVIIGRGRDNLHWRGDKAGFQDFAGAFQNLQGADAPLDVVGMQEFSDFLAACWYVPNPYRVYKPNSQSSTTRLNPTVCAALAPRSNRCRQP